MCSSLRSRLPLNPRTHVKRRQFAILQLVFLVSVARGGSLLPAGESGDTGTIEGTVTYRADSARPWRYSRHYIRRPGSGELSEAVVAIRRLRSEKDTTPREPQTVNIDQKDFQFVPELVAIRAGDSVHFTNSDDSIHNVRASTRIATFNVTVPPRGSHTERFPKAGGIRDPVHIGCVFHSSMRAWIFVFDHPHFAVTDVRGRFRLTGLPPGQYELEMAHPAGELRRMSKVEVPAGQSLTVDISVSPDDKR